MFRSIMNSDVIYTASFTQIVKEPLWNNNFVHITVRFAMEYIFFGVIVSFFG